MSSEMANCYVIKFQSTNFYRDLSNGSKLVEMLHGMKLYEYSTYKDTRIVVNDFGDVYTIHIISGYELVIEPSIKCKFKAINRLYEELKCFFAKDKIELEGEKR